MDCHFRVGNERSKNNRAYGTTTLEKIIKSQTESTKSPIKTKMKQKTQNQKESLAQKAEKKEVKK